MAELKKIHIPNIGDFDSVEVIEVMVKVGDKINIEDSLITVESDKASMDIPSPASGLIKSIDIKVGDEVKEGSLILSIDSEIEDSSGEKAPEEKKQATQKKEVQSAPQGDKSDEEYDVAVLGSGPGGYTAAFRAADLGLKVVLIERYTTIGGVCLNVGCIPSKALLHTAKVITDAEDTASHGVSFSQPKIDLDRLRNWKSNKVVKKLSGANLHRNWVTAPHVTQFDNADITDLEIFRKSMQKEAEKRGAKLTLLAFLIKASVNALKAYPMFNSSLSPDGDNLIMKSYYNVGFACDTPDGLVVPVVKDVQKKDVIDIAEDLGNLSEKARARKLKMDEMQGGCFTISSLGGIGGTKFTPIINCPEVAILGVSRASMQPVFNKSSEDFEARLMLPLSLSYDHRVVDGADGARFTSHLCMMLSDVRRLLL